MLLSTVACGGNAETDLETAFCAALDAPANKTVTASADAAGAPDATDAARVDVSLPDGRGFVRYQPDEAGKFAFGFTEDVSVLIRDEAGNEIPFEASVTGATKCTSLAVRFTAPLELKTYTLEIGPTSAATIGLVAEESDDDL